MKRKLILCSLFLAALSIRATDTLTLDLTAFLADFNQTEDGYWDGTYSDMPVETDYFLFSHKGEQNNGEMSYWEGFTICTSGDMENYGAEGSSDAWITHQWGCMAGGGLNENCLAERDKPYMVAYWGFHAEKLDPDYHSLRVNFADGKQHKAVGVWICNHPWPYYGNINGDGFASAFTQEGDYFALVAHGLNDKGEPTGVSTKLMLATYSNGQLRQSRDWQYMDLTTLGTLSGIYFTMETTDNDALYGANTAVYFCLDRMQVLAYEDESQTIARPSGLNIEAADEETITLTWNKTAHAEKYNLYLDGDSIGQTADTLYVFNGLEPLTEYTLSVVACNGDQLSEIASITASTLDLTAPSAPSGLTAEATQYSITITWQPATDNVAVKRYTIYLNGEPTRRIAETTYTIQGLEPATEYMVEVEAEDYSGNKSTKAVVTVSTLTLTAVDSPIADKLVEGYYTLNGVYISNSRPNVKGIYIKVNNHKITQIINH